MLKQCSRVEFIIVSFWSIWAHNETVNTEMLKGNVYVLCSSVSSTGVEIRDGRDVQKKWDNLKFECKKKYFDFKKHTRKTGNVWIEISALTPLCM